MGRPRTGLTKICKICQSPFWVRSSFKDRECCSRTCASTIRKRSKVGIRKNLVELSFRTCPICVVSFKVTNRRRRFCSRSCYALFRVKEELWSAISAVLNAIAYRFRNMLSNISLGSQPVIKFTVLFSRKSNQRFTMGSMGRIDNISITIPLWNGM